MITVLEYLVIAAVIGLVVFGIAVFVFGRGEQLAALSPRTSPSELPEGTIGGDDVHRVRFGLALRGYRMSDVDWTLDRLATELDRLHRRIADLGGEPIPVAVGADPGGAGEIFGDLHPDGSASIDPAPAPAVATAPSGSAPAVATAPSGSAPTSAPPALVADPAAPPVDERQWAPRHRSAEPGPAPAGPDDPAR